MLYSSVPGGQTQQSQQQQQQQQSDNGSQQQQQPPGGYHPGIPSPPNEHDVSQRVHFSGSESGMFAMILDYKIRIRVM